MVEARMMRVARVAGEEDQGVVQHCPVPLGDGFQLLDQPHDELGVVRPDDVQDVVGLASLVLGAVAEFVLGHVDAEPPEGNAHVILPHARGDGQHVGKPADQRRGAKLEVGLQPIGFQGGRVLVAESRRVLLQGVFEFDEVFLLTAKSLERFEMSLELFRSLPVNSGSARRMSSTMKSSRLRSDWNCCLALPRATLPKTVL